jgi:arylsulfatase
VKGDTQVLFGGMGRLSENSVINIKNKSHAVTADLTVAAGGAGGVIIAQGGTFGGWTLYVHQGRPAYCYNLLGVQQFKTYGDKALGAGDHQVRMEFGYDGDGLGKGGDVTLYIDGVQVGQGRVDATQPMIFSADETTDLGSDTATPVSDDYDPSTSTFNGRVKRVQIDLGADAEDADHLITAEERYRIAVALQ